LLKPLIQQKNNSSKKPNQKHNASPRFPFPCRLSKASNRITE